jgi:fructokinase
MEIVTLGELILDMFASESGKDFFSVTAFLPVAGGAPANVAVAASRLGVESAFIGKVGEDQFGRRLQKVLEEYGVNTRGMRYDTRCRTTLNFMTVPDARRTEMLFYRNPGADMMLEPAELDTALIERSSVYHFGSVSLAVEPCRSAALEGALRARKAGVLVSFDVNYRPGLWDSEARAMAEITAAIPLADIVKVNETELRFIAGTDDAVKGCRVIVDRGPALCVATLGPDGSAWATVSGAGTAAGFKVRAVDATGCGDAFMAALLVQVLAALGGRRADRRARLEGLGREILDRAVRYANAAGAVTARKRGVMNALPDAREVQKLLEPAPKAKAKGKAKAPRPRQNAVKPKKRTGGSKRA